jgi:hypothetical protein
MTCYFTSTYSSVNRTSNFQTFVCNQDISLWFALIFVPTRIESAPIRESDGVEEALGEGQSAGEENRGVAGAKEGRRKHRFQGSLGSRDWPTTKIPETECYARESAGYDAA